MGVTVVIAGVFAFAPIEEAKTLHLPSVTADNLASGAIEIPVMWATINPNNDTFLGQSFINVDENRAQVVVPLDGTIKSLFVEIGTAPGVGTSWDITLRLNEADTALTCQIEDDNTTCSDTVNSFTVEAGDEIAAELDETGVTAAAFRFAVSFVYTIP